VKILISLKYFAEPWKKRAGATLTAAVKAGAMAAVAVEVEAMTEGEMAGHPFRLNLTHAHA
jgi:hypothetical protein